MGLLEDFDNHVTSLGFRKSIDIGLEELDRTKTEECFEVQSNPPFSSDCYSAIGREIVLLDLQFPMDQAIAIYILFSFLADYKPKDVMACNGNITIEIVGEGDNYSITIDKIQFNPCILVI